MLRVSKRAVETGLRSMNLPTGPVTVLLTMTCWTPLLKISWLTYLGLEAS